VVTTDIYTYNGVVVEVLNEGLPRAAYLIIGDRSTRTLCSRIGFSYTLIIFQIILGAIMTVVFVAASEHLAGAFVPEQVRQSSLTYVRISSVLALSSTMETAVSSCTRALDHPDVPLIISSTKFVVNILLDMLVVSKFHVGSFKPTVNTQAIVRLGCDMTSSLCGLVYFLYLSLKMKSESQVEGPQKSAAPSLRALKVLARPSVYTFIESALRNALYLWLVAGIISMSADYATAWGIFNTIRWGLVMVPVQALQASTLTFVGHNWGQWRSQTGADRRRPKASKKDIYGMFPVYLWAIVTANQHQKPFPNLHSSLASSPSSSKSQSAFSYRYGASRASHTTSLSHPASLTSRRACGRSVNPSIPFPPSINSQPFST